MIYLSTWFPASGPFSCFRPQELSLDLRKVHVFPASMPQAVYQDLQSIKGKNRTQDLPVELNREIE